MSIVPLPEPPARNVFRWAIGSSDGPRSSAWRFWGNTKGDIYVAVRSHGGIIKASFHRDGKCQVGFTQDYAATATQRFAVSSRHWEKWLLPAVQVVRVLQVMVPHSELRSFVDRKPHNVTWLPTPPEGSVAVSSIFLTTQANALPMPLPGCADVAIVVGKVPTSTRTAWLVYDHTPIDAALAALINDERAQMHSIPGAENWQLGTRAVLWEHRVDHDRHALELACD